jgi:hypothetical protein
MMVDSSIGQTGGVVIFVDAVAVWILQLYGHRATASHIRHPAMQYGSTALILK